MRRYLKICSLFVVALLFISILRPVSAQKIPLALEGSSVSLTPLSMASIKDTLFIYASDSVLFSYDMETGNTLSFHTALPKRCILVENSDEVTAISIADGAVYKLNIQGGRAVPELVVQLNWQDVLPPDHLISWTYDEAPDTFFRRAIRQGDTLFLLLSNSTGSAYHAVSFHLLTGERKPTVLKNIWDIAAYTNDSVLILQASGDGPGSISACNANTGAVRQLAALPQGYDHKGIAYSDDQGTVYILGTGVVYGFASGPDWEEAGYSSIAKYANVTAAAMGAGKYFALIPGSAVYCFPLNNDGEIAALHLIQGWWDEDALYAFRAAHPEIPLVFEAYSHTNTEELHQKILSYDEAFDVYVVNTGSDIYGAMLDKGYAVNLCASAGVAQAFERMYPHFALVLSKEGDAFAFPIKIAGNVLSYHAELFSEYGLPVPRTLMELLDFCAAQSEAGSHVLFHSSNNPSRHLLSYLISVYTAGMHKQNGFVTYDTKLFKELMEQWETYAPLFDRAGNYGTLMEGIEPLLGQTVAPLKSQFDYLSDAYKPLALALTDGGEPVIPAYMEVAVINPSSRNIPNAIKFLEFYAQHMSGELPIILFPDENEPVVEPGRYKRAQEMVRFIDEQKQALSTAKPEEKKYLEDLIQQNQRMLEGRNLWKYSPEAIETYRNLAGYLIFAPQRMTFNSGYPQIADLFNLFAERKITCAQFIQQLTRIQNVMELENSR